MNRTIAMLLFALVLFLGLPSIAMAHEGHQHSPSASQTTVAGKEDKVTETLQLKVEAVKKNMLSDECPCGKSCTKCACFSHTCCKIMSQFTITHNVAAEKKPYTLTSFLHISGIHPESLTKPPQAA